MENFWALLTPQAFIAPVTGGLLVLMALFHFFGPRGGILPPLRREPVTKADTVWALGLASAFYLVAGWRIGFPNQAVFDECYHGRTGMQYVIGQSPMEWSHPPLAKLLIALSLKATGARFDPTEGIFQPAGPFAPDTAAAWRFPSLIFGALTLLMVFALARSLTGNRRAAIGAVALLAVDGIFFVQSRIAMINIYTVFFLVSASLGIWKWRRSDRLSWLWLAGIGLGCALSTRWTALYALGLLGIFVIAVELPRLGKRKPAAAIASVAALIGAFIALPAAIYLLSYVPELVQQKHDLEWLRGMQTQMWNYHTGLKVSHNYASPWWAWPLMLRPTWYYTGGGPNQFTGIVAIGNITLWWAFVPTLAMATLVAVRDKRSEMGFVALLGLGLWLLWGVQPRTLVFTHYLLEALPFAAIALATFGAQIWQAGGAPRNLARAYLLLAVGWLVYFYPLLSAQSVSMPYYGNHLWLGLLWV